MRKEKPSKGNKHKKRNKHKKEDLPEKTTISPRDKATKDPNASLFPPQWQPIQKMHKDFDGRLPLIGLEQDPAIISWECS